MARTKRPFARTMSSAEAALHEGPHRTLDAERDPQIARDHVRVAARHEAQLELPTRLQDALRGLAQGPIPADDHETLGFGLEPDAKWRRRAQRSGGARLPAGVGECLPADRAADSPVPRPEVGLKRRRLTGSGHVPSIPPAGWVSKRCPGRGDLQDEAEMPRRQRPGRGPA